METQSQFDEVEQDENTDTETTNEKHEPDYQALYVAALEEMKALTELHEFLSARNQELEAAVSFLQQNEK